MEKLKNLSASVSQNEALALLDKAPDSEPFLEDCALKNQHNA